MQKKSLIIISPFITRSGYGVHSRVIIKSLLNSKITDNYDVGLIAVPWGGTPMTALNSENEEDKKLLSLMLPGNQLNFQPDVSIHITIPSEFQKIGKFSIGITAGTEGSIAPPSFVEGCNRVDLVITPSQFTKLVLQSTRLDKRDQRTNAVVETVSVKTPVETLFEGVDTNVFGKNKSTAQVNLSGIKEDFAFLFVGHWLQGNIFQDRKDVSGLVHTFLKTFMLKKKKPALILKTSGAGFSITERDQIINKIQQIQELIQEQENFKGEFPSVYVINGDLTDEEMNSLYNHPKIKAMVSYTKGEGFGLPLLEFTLSGKPVICSNYSGPVDFLNPEYSFLLPGKLTQIDSSAANEWIPKEGQWFSVNYVFASQMLKDMFENYDKYIERSRKHIKYTKDNFTLEKMGDKFLEILERYINITEKVPERVSLKLPQLKKIV